MMCCFKRVSLYMALLQVLVGCSVEYEAELPVFSEYVAEGNGVRIPDSDFIDFSQRIVYMSDTAAFIGRLYDVADSLSVEYADSETLECLSDQFASVFFNPDSPYCDDRIYSMVLEQEEMRIADFPPYHKKMLDFRSDILSLGVPGSEFPYPCQGNVPNVVVVKSEDCAECDRIVRELSQSRVISRAERRGNLKVSVQNVSDGMLMAVSLDPRYIPSIYLVDSDGVILLKACRSVDKLLKSNEFKNIL